jgi:hypothetical protein
MKTGYLLRVLYFFENCPILRSALFRGTQFQQVWSKEGDPTSVCIADCVSDDSWPLVLSETTDLQLALNQCLQRGAVARSLDQNEEESYSLNPDWQGKLQATFTRQQLVIPGAILVSHIYPREEVLDKR